MLRRHMGLLFTLIVLGCSVQTLLAQETRGRGETDRLVKGLRSMESRLTSLWMKGTWTTEVYDRNTQAMGEPLVDHFVAAFEGAPGGRTYLARNTIPARPEGVPTSNWRPRYETRFNGRVGLFLSENSGRGEEESPRGSITAEFITNCGIGVGRRRCGNCRSSERPPSTVSGTVRPLPPLPSGNDFRWKSRQGPLMGSLPSSREWTTVVPGAPSIMTQIVDTRSSACSSKKWGNCA